MTAVGDLFRAHAPAVLDERLGVMRRVRVQALRADDKALFDALQAARLAFDFEVAADEARWREGALHVAATATLRSRGGPGCDPPDLRRAPETRRPGSSASAPRSTAGSTSSPATVPAGCAQEDLGRLELTVRHRETSVEWPLPCTLTRCDTTTAAGDLVPAVRVEARIDPSSGVFGQRLEDGIWDVLARADFLGEGNAAPVRFAGRQPGGQTRLELRSARAYVTTGGRLAVKLTPTPTGGALGKDVRVTGAGWQGEELTLTVSGTPSAGASVLLRPRAGGAPEVTMPVGPVERGRVRLDPRPSAAAGTTPICGSRPRRGVLDERLRLGPVTIAQHPPYAVAARGGALSIRRLDAEEAPPAALVVRPAQDRAGCGGPAGRRRPVGSSRSCRAARAAWPVGSADGWRRRVSRR